MRLFAPDLFRNFGIGFALGAVLIVGAKVDDWSEAVASPAQAAELRADPQAAPAHTQDFVIAPIEG